MIIDQSYTEPLEQYEYLGADVLACRAGRAGVAIRNDPGFPYTLSDNRMHFEIPEED